MRNLVAADMAGITAGSTRSRMDPFRTLGRFEYIVITMRLR
jgi:hypothetical protein